MGQRVRVLIADDCPHSRDGLRALLDLWPRVEVIGEATSGREAVQLVKECRPDVIVMDVQMPVLNGLRVTQIIKSEWPEIRVVVLTMHAGYRGAALAAGADGFLLKGCPTQDLVEGLLGRRCVCQARGDTEGNGVDPRTPESISPQ
jgi:DNA-binding NarL/FixJ family response regulator